jgi:raffinose/stachyose/melibiose transport system permease protein
MWPSGAAFAGLDNYVKGIIKSGFVKAMGYSFFITICSVIVIIILSSMTAWYITRRKSKVSSSLYYLFVFSMIVPFQMVMFSMSKIANILHLDTPIGIIVLYLGFGSGLSIFIFSGFVKGIPLEIEEAAMIDGCNPLQTYFQVVFPLLRPTAITVAILEAMWVWNDYLLPLLVIGNKYKTIPVAIQGVLTGSYGARDMGSLMAMLVLTILPIIVFYLLGQKSIIKGVISGAVKG